MLGLATMKMVAAMVIWKLELVHGGDDEDTVMGDRGLRSRVRSR